MHVFSDIESTKYFLDKHCLLGEVEKVLSVVLLHFFYFELLSGVEASKQGLDADGCLLFPEKFLPLLEHPELGLDPKGAFVVAIPIFFGLVGTKIVELGERVFEVFLLLQ